jgi:hypothetical protein
MASSEEPPESLIAQARHLAASIARKCDHLNNVPGARGPAVASLRSESAELERLLLQLTSADAASESRAETRSIAKDVRNRLIAEVVIRLMDRLL